MRCATLTGRNVVASPIACPSCTDRLYVFGNHTKWESAAERSAHDLGDVRVRAHAPWGALGRRRFSPRAEGREEGGGARAP